MYWSIQLTWGILKLTNSRALPSVPFNKKIKVIKPPQSCLVLSREVSCVWYRMTEVVIRLVGEITPPSPLVAHWRTSAQFNILSAQSDGKQATPISSISDYWRRHSPLLSVLWRCADHCGRSSTLVWHRDQISILSSWWISLSWLAEEGGWEGELVKFSNFLPWEIRVTLLKIGTIHGLASLKCLGGPAIDKENIYNKNICRSDIRYQHCRLKFAFSFLVINVMKPFQLLSLLHVLICWISNWFISEGLDRY